MKKVVNDSQNDIRQTVILTKYYSFDLGKYTIKDLITKWMEIYPCHWLPLAVTEAIYQGRLKAISIEQILSNWHKKGEINYSFNHEFIRIIQPEVNFRLQQERESQKIIHSLSEPQPQVNHLSGLKVISKEPDTLVAIAQTTKTESKIISIAQLNELDSTNDSSQSFKKLKSLVVNNKDEEKRNFYQGISFSN